MKLLEKLKQNEMGKRGVYLFSYLLAAWLMALKINGIVESWHTFVLGSLLLTTIFSHWQAYEHSQITIYGMHYKQVVVRALVLGIVSVPAFIYFDFHIPLIAAACWLVMMCATFWILFDIRIAYHLGKEPDYYGKESGTDRLMRKLGSSLLIKLGILIVSITGFYYFI